jgi:hypothetical protein
MNEMLTFTMLSAWVKPRAFHVPDKSALPLGHSPYYPHFVGGKLRHRETKSLAKSHTAPNKWS